jgi:hypothetical protein
MQYGGRNREAELRILKKVRLRIAVNSTARIQKESPSHK